MLTIGEHLHRTAIGDWYQTDAGPAQLLDPHRTSVAGAVPRLVAHVTRLRSPALAVVAPIADLVSDAERIWLILGSPATPTLTEILAGPPAGRPSTVRVDPAASGDPAAPVGPAALAAGTGFADIDLVSVVRHTGEALRSLHRAGLTHGSVDSGIFVVSTDSSVTLLDTGIADALAGTVTAPDADIAAWAGVLTQCAQARPGSAAHLSAAAEAARARGIEAALAVLAAPKPVPAVTLLRADVPEPESTVVLTADAVGTRMGQRRARMSADETVVVGAPDRPGGVLRFGPGVPAASSLREPRRATGRRRGMRRGLVSGLITAVIAGAVATWLIWEYTPPLRVAQVAVAPAGPVVPGCHLTVEVTGFIHTTGRGGTVTYEWFRSDGQTSGLLRQKVSGGSHDTEVRMIWAFAGPGHYPATATLRVLDPVAPAASTAFTYQCTQR